MDTKIIQIDNLTHINQLITNSKIKVFPELKEYHFKKELQYYALQHNENIIDILVLIEKGEFILGDIWGDGYEDEKPCKNIFVENYLISIFPVTNAMFCYWLNNSNIDTTLPIYHYMEGYTRFSKQNDLYQPYIGFEYKPVTTVTWHGAYNYCKDLKGMLPNEIEWEKASSWNNSKRIKYKFPYGNNIKLKKMRVEGDFSVLNYEKLLPSIQENLDDKSPNGLIFSAGTVWEWCVNDYSPTTYENNSFIESLSPSLKAVRGGGWSYGKNLARTTNRGRDYSMNGEMTNGFRYARNLNNIKLKTKRTKKVFISYSSKDKNLCNKIVKNLLDKNINLWVDQIEIKAGDSLIDKIQNGLDESSILISLISTYSNQSEWVKKELNYFLIKEINESKIKIIPFVIDNVDLPIFLQEKKQILFYELGFKKSLLELIEALE